MEQKLSFRDYLSILNLARKDFRYWFTIPFHFLFSNIVVKRKEGKIIGFIIYKSRWLHYFIIHKDHRSKGYGRKMLKRIMGSIKNLYVHPNNKRAIRFYEQFGFQTRKEQNKIYGKRLHMVLD